MKKSYSDFIKNIDKGVVDYNNPKCINCNDCCGILTLISENEYQELKKYFTKNKIGKEIYKVAVKRVLTEMRERDALYLQCPLNTGTKKCVIYDRRPSVCRDFHCKAELNKVTEDVEKRKEVYGKRMIFQLFEKDLLKNEEFRTRLMLLTRNL